ncbi:MAG: transglutaminase-like domain-containing protein, partial [Pseudomonadota bacterium]
IAAQQYSAAGKIDVQSFFLATRKRTKQQYYEPRKINVSYLYALFVILSTGSANVKGPGFFISICIFSAWALWQTRSNRYSPVVWLICLSIILVSGHVMHVTIRSASIKITHWAMDRYAQYYLTNPFKNYTALGEIGELKFSDKIMLRVWVNHYVPGQAYLLHNATYNKFARSNWFSSSQFTAIPSKNAQTFWQINPDPALSAKTSAMTIYSRPFRNKAVLSLPSGVITIAKIKAGSCEKNPFQAVRIEDVPGLIKSKVTYTNQLSYDAEPDKTDLFIPQKELPGIIEFAQTLLLKDKSEQEILTLLKHHFSTRFTYSLDLSGKGRYSTPLQNFLHHTRSGHCELFSTATALILRQAGIPARYATGYMAHEYSPFGNHIIVRQRDAHSWTKVYINGQWQNFDTTPPSFLQIDSQTSDTSWLMDLVSYLGFKLSKLRHETGADLMNRYGLWLTLPLGLILFFRLKKTGHIKRLDPSTTVSANKEKQRCNDAFLTIETLLNQSGFTRHPFETRRSWCQRISPRLEPKGIQNMLEKILKPYYRHRFSQFGLTRAQKIGLETDIKRFSNTWKKNHP